MDSAFVTGDSRLPSPPSDLPAILQCIIDQSQALIFSVDKSYRYTSFNQGHAAVMKALYGVDIELGHILLEYMTVSEDRLEAKRNLDRALAGEASVESSYSGEDKRTRSYLEVAHHPVRSNDGQVTGVAVIAKDMTALKLAEEKMVMATGTSENPNPVARIQANGILFYANDACLPLLTYWGCQVGQPLAEKYCEDIYSHYADGKNWDEEVVVQDQSFLLQWVPVPETGYVNLYGKDVTRRKQAEDALRKSEEHYRWLFEHVRHGYANCEMLFENDQPQDFIYLEVNSAFERITGLKGVEGKRVSQLIPGIQEDNPELF